MIGNHVHSPSSHHSLCHCSYFSFHFTVAQQHLLLNHHKKQHLLIILCIFVFQLFPSDILVRKEAGPALHTFDIFLFE